MRTAHLVTAGYCRVNLFRHVGATYMLGEDIDSVETDAKMADILSHWVP